jgi:predicted transposase YdaD
MLLIPAAVRKLKREGRLEGRQEGRLEGRHERDKRYEEAYRRFGVEVDGVVMLPRTAEVREFLNRNSEESGNPGD